MAWLRARGADRSTEAKLEVVTGELSSHMAGALGEDLAREIAWELAIQFVPATAVINELVRELSTGKRADRRGLELTGHFLRKHPDLLGHLRASVGELDDLNEQEIFNALVARALSLTREADGEAELP